MTKSTGVYLPRPEGIKVSASAFMAVQIGAMQFGGIGAFRSWKDVSTPVCARGLINWVCGQEGSGENYPAIIDTIKLFPGSSDVFVNDSLFKGCGANTRFAVETYLAKLEQKYGPVTWVK